jgi:hypothetical protein
LVGAGGGLREELEAGESKNLKKENERDAARRKNQIENIRPSSPEKLK